MASKNDSKNTKDIKGTRKSSEAKNKKAAAKSNVKSNSDTAAVASLQKLLDKALADNKKLEQSYKSLTEDNKKLKHAVKEVEIERNSLRKQSDSYLKRDRLSQDKISKLQDDVANNKSELSRIKKEKDDRLSIEKQEINEKLKELKRKEKELERERLAVDKEIGVLRKLKEDTKQSANAIAKSVSKMSHVDEDNSYLEDTQSRPKPSKKAQTEQDPRGGSYFDELDRIFEKFATVLSSALQSSPSAQGGQLGEPPTLNTTLNLDGLGDILDNFAVVLKDALQGIEGTQERDTSYLGQLDHVFDKFAGVMTEAMQNMPAAQITAIPVSQVSTTADPTTPQSTKMMENLSSYLEKATENISLAPPQVIISPQTIAPPPAIEGLTNASDRDPSAMIGKKPEPPEASTYSDMPIMRMKLDKDDDIYEDRLVITYTFDNMPENRVYSKYKKILRNAVRITLLGNLQEGLELFHIIKNQNISEEYKSMIDKNISDITYYIRGKHRARLE